MGFVVRISGRIENSPQWIGHNMTVGPKRLVDRDQARVFPTEFEASREAETFRAILTDGLKFEIERALR
jgi:hypothetical protein